MDLQAEVTMEGTTMPTATVTVASAHCLGVPEVSSPESGMVTCINFWVPFLYGWHSCLGITNEEYGINFCSSETTKNVQTDTD